MNSPQLPASPSPFGLQLKAPFATKAAAESYARHLAKSVPDEDIIEIYAQLKFGQLLLEKGLEALKERALQAATEGNIENSFGLKIAVAAGRTSLDLAGISQFDRAQKRFTKAKENLKATEAKLKAKGKGNITYGTPQIRVTIP